MIFTGNGDRGRSNIINQKGIYKEQERLTQELESLEKELNELRGQKNQMVQAQAKIHSTAGKEEEVELEEQLQAIEKKNLGMVIAGILAVIVGIVGIIGRFQLTDEMSKMRTQLA